MISVLFLSENKTEKELCDAEFGLSMKIVTEEKTILFDSGFSDLLIKNAARLGEPLEDIDACVLSHGHDDHANGIPAFMEANQTATLYMHKNAVRPSYENAGGKPAGGSIGIHWDPAEYADRTVLTDEPVWLTENIVISGTIPMPPDYQATEYFLIQGPDGSYVNDPMDHEQFLAIRGKDGVYLFSGCSHKGIAAAIDYCHTLFPDEPVAGVIAGLHLMSATTKMRQAVIDRLSREHLKVLIPMHCTGIEALVMLKSHFAENCLLASAGRHFKLDK